MVAPVTERELRISVAIHATFKRLLCACHVPSTRGKSKEQNTYSTAILSLPPDIQKAFKLKTVSD